MILVYDLKFTLSSLLRREDRDWQSHVDQSDVLEDVLEEILDWVENFTDLEDQVTIQLVTFHHRPLVVLKEQAQDEELDLPVWLTHGYTWERRLNDTSVVRSIATSRSAYISWNHSY